MNIFSNLFSDKAECLSSASKIFAVFWSIVTFVPTANAVDALWNPAQTGSSAAPLNIVGNYWKRTGSTYTEALQAGDKAYFADLNSGNYYLNINYMPTLLGLYVYSKDTILNLSGSSMALIDSVNIAEGTLNLSGGANSAINVSSMSMSNGALRLTNVGNLNGITFSNFTISSTEIGKSSLIFGALVSSTNENRNVIAYSDGGVGATHRIAANRHFLMEVEEFTNVSISGVNYNNASGAFGGAVHVGYSSSVGNFEIKLNDNSSLFFQNNVASTDSADAFGGALYSYGTLTIDAGIASNLKFTSNTVNVLQTYESKGGAIYGNGAIQILANSNSSIEFFDNESTYYGGAIFANDTLTIRESGENLEHIIAFDGNVAGLQGGAIYANGDAELSNAIFVNNSASLGGAIYAKGNVEFTIGENMGELVSAGNTGNSSGFIYMAGSGKALSFDVGSGSRYVIGVDDSYDDGLMAVSGGNSVLVKLGAGALEINSNSSDWNGRLDVQEGEIAINGTFGNSTSVLNTIGASGKLSGSGMLFGATTVQQGGTLSPGDRFGTLIFNGILTLEGGSILEIDNGDQIDISGTLTVAADALENKIIISLENFTGSAIEDYLLVSADSITLSALSEDINDYFSFANPDFEGTVKLVGTDVYIDGVFIPEPSECAAIFGILALALAVWKRRK